MGVGAHLRTSVNRCLLRNRRHFGGTSIFPSTNLPESLPGRGGVGGRARFPPFSRFFNVYQQFVMEKNVRK